MAIMGYKSDTELKRYMINVLCKHALFVRKFGGFNTISVWYPGSIIGRNKRTSLHHTRVKDGSQGPVLADIPNDSHSYNRILYVTIVIIDSIM